MHPTSGLHPMVGIWLRLIYYQFLEYNVRLSIYLCIYHNGRGSEIRSIEGKEDYLLSDEIRPRGQEDHLITDKLPI